MDKENLDVKRINKILKKTISAIDEGKKEMFDIAENARTDVDILKSQLNDLQNNLTKVIDEVDKLEVDERISRNTLSKVSESFDRYSEEDIRKAYETANNLRIKLMLKRQEEKELIKRRNDLEIRLKNSLKTLEKAEKLVTQVGVAMEYLNGDLDSIVESVEDMSKKQFLGVKVIEMQEEERQRVARDIHDGPAQSMANLVLKTELCEKLLDIDKNRVKEELKDLKGIVRGSLKDIRKIIYDLRPMSLDDLGLIPTVKRYGYDFTEETDIKVEVRAINEEIQIKSIIQLAVFRIIQEALNNVRKHSNADRVSIYIENGDKFLNLIIKDDGIGFNKEKALDESSDINGGFGLMGMKERAQLLNGELDIISNPGDGTKIVLIIPINRKDEVNNE
ncbi:MAG: sensor histidine kinase [Firmicutes bacterium]|nr:sensor histidine kinase [Bacillota bacterium]